ncbi:UNVERIFIED_CONTAM: hypothetical protein NCL1_44693 [Trichonephila clavipes]
MCWAMMATFVLEALPVNAAFQSTFSGLTPGVVVWGTISYHKRSNLIRIEETSMKCYSPKSFPSFKAFMELSFSRLMHTHMLQRLFENSVQLNTCNFYFGQLIRYMSLFITCGIWSVSLSLVIRRMQLQKTSFFRAYKQY